MKSGFPGRVVARANPVSAPESEGERRSNRVVLEDQGKRVHPPVCRTDFTKSFDTERASGYDTSGDFRSPFQIDRDRVLHTHGISQASEQDPGVLEWRVRFLSYPINPFAGGGTDWQIDLSLAQSTLVTFWEVMIFL